jgi:hypothetical protein
MDEFEALVQSLGESLVAYIGREQIRHLSLQLDEATYSAIADICLNSEAYVDVMNAIERIGEVRLMFMDELSFDYVLTASDDCRPSEPSPQRELVFA